MNNFDKTLVILESTDLFESFIVEAIEEDQWDKFLKTLTKMSTKVNDKFATAKDLLREVFNKAKESFDLVELKKMLTRPSKAILNSELAKYMVDAVNSAGATISMISVKTAAREA